MLRSPGMRARRSGEAAVFTMKEENGKAEVDKVYSVLEDPVHLRWMYREYSREGSHCFQTERRYYMGSGAGKRYYIDVVRLRRCLWMERATPGYGPSGDGISMKPVKGSWII